MLADRSCIWLACPSSEVNKKTPPQLKIIVYTAFLTHAKGLGTLGHVARLPVCLLVCLPVSFTCLAKKRGTRKKGGVGRRHFTAFLTAPETAYFRPNSDFPQQQGKNGSADAGVSARLACGMFLRSEPVIVSSPDPRVGKKWIVRLPVRLFKWRSSCSLSPEHGCSR